MSWWKFGARSNENSGELTTGRRTITELIHSELERCAKVPGIWVWREDKGWQKVMRVFLAGNPPLDAPASDPPPNVISLNDYCNLRRSLIQLLYPEADLLDPRGSQVAIYRNYLRIQHDNSLPPDILSDQFVAAVIGALEPVLGWSVMPQWQEAPTSAGFEKGHTANVRWQLGHYS